MTKRTLSLLVFVLSAAAAAAGQDLLRSLARPQDFAARRVSSYDRTGGNKDSLTIKAGETAVLAEIKGPGAIDHIWVTIAAEPFYGRKIVLRIYWDGEPVPSVEAPIGDFFGVGHGLNRNLSSLPINDSSEGRARNCYWTMPFERSARVTVTNEGREEVPAFYYYLDYRALPSLAAGTPTFHAVYRQETPCSPGRNYLLLEAEGRGHYVGCSLSVLQRSLGWWGEGDDMIYVDGESFPSLHGTGSEDYFSDAWGMREGAGLFYGCPLQEEDFQAGSKATVYRFHIPDPIPFQRSIRVTIEHGHSNDRSDHYSSTAYWYQAEPHKPFPPLPPVKDRLPFALEPPAGFILPAWTETPADGRTVFEDRAKALRFEAEKLTSLRTSYYLPGGDRYPALTTEGARPGSEAKLSFSAAVGERYDIDLFLLKGPAQGTVKAAVVVSGGRSAEVASPSFEGYSGERGLGTLSLKNVRLEAGPNTIVLRTTGESAAGPGSDLALVGLSLTPSERKFITDWDLIGPFDAPDMDSLTTAYPPEREVDRVKSYPGKGGRPVSWRRVQGSPSGYMNLLDLVQPPEQIIVYALGYVRAPEDMTATLLLGSDDGVRVWVNEALVHSNPAYRPSDPDQDLVPVKLRKGWNKVLLKVLQGAGGAGFHARFADPEGKLAWSTEPGRGN